MSQKPLTVRSTNARKPVNDRFKPEGFEHYLTIAELAKVVKRNVSWIKQLERADRIPEATRVKVGLLSVRLYSPEQVQEIESIFATFKPGPKRKEDDNA